MILICQIVIMQYTPCQYASLDIGESMKDVVFMNVIVITPNRLILSIPLKIAVRPQVHFNIQYYMMFQRTHFYMKQRVSFIQKIYSCVK